MSYAAAVEALRDLVVLLSGIGDTLVLLSYGDLGRPSATHLTLTPLPDRAVGWSQRTAANQVTQERQGRIQIDAWGAGAVAGLRQCATLLQSLDARVLAAPVAIQGIGDIRDTTAIWMTKYEPRATLEVLIGYAVVYTASDSATATQIGLTVEGEGAIEATISVEILDAP